MISREFPHEGTRSQSLPDEGDAEGVEMLRMLWRKLPLELAINLTLALALIPAAVVWVEVSPWLALPLAAACGGPFWLAAIATGLHTQENGSVGYVEFMRSVRRWAKTGWIVAAVPVSALLLTAATSQIWLSHPHERWLAVPVIADLMVMIVVAVASLHAFPLSLMFGGGPRRVWVGAIACASAAPGITICAAFVVALLVAVTALVGPGLLVAWPAALAFYLASMTRRAVRRVTDRRVS